MKSWPLIKQIVDFILYVVEKILSERQARKDEELKKIVLNDLVKAKKDEAKKA